MDVIKMTNRILFSVYLAISVTATDAQTKYLDRKITLDLPSCSLEVALLEISKAANFRLSYDAGMIPGHAPVRVSARATQVSTLLEEILGKDVKTKEIGNHVILVRDRTGAREKKPFREITLTGVILDATNRTPIGDATVYEVENKKSAVTGKNGNYKLVIPSGKKVRSLAYCKTGYADTVIFLRQSASLRVDMLLHPLEGNISHMNTLPGSIVVNATDSMRFVKWLVPRETMVNSQNLEVRTSATFQVSIIPYIGTNWKVTGSVTNRFSLNLLAGYTGGLRGIEVGGLLNVTRNMIKGFQIGGLGNIVGGGGKGWQIGGLFNFDLGKFEGVQVGGLFNYAPDTIAGLQVGGLTNVIKGKIKGIQVSGLANVVTQNCDGWQLAGIANLTLKDTRRVQISGLFNFGNNLEGLQLAGLVNIARRQNSGVQVAGLLNYATTLHGLQVGLVNVANTVEKGLPIGLFSYVQQGYHIFELSANEIFYGNVAFKSGTRTFYNFLQAGMGSDYKLQVSYGIGTIFRLKKKISVNIDASAGFVYHPTDTVYHGLLVKFNPAFEYRVLKHFAVFAGPAYNFFLFSRGKPSATARGLSIYDFYFKSTDNASIQMWIGGVLGVRL